MPLTAFEVKGLYFSGSYLYWKASFSDFSVAALEHSEAPTGDRELLQIKNLKFPYSSGFKLGAGYIAPGTGCDLFLNWTWIRNSPSLHLQQDKINIVKAITVEDNFNTSGAIATGRTKLNVGDLEVGKMFCGNNLYIRPFAGLKTAWLQYSYATLFSDATNGETPILELTDRYKDHLWGIGPRFGFTSRWNLGETGLSILFNAAGSLLWEDFHPEFSSTYVEDNAPHGGIVKGHLSMINPVTEIFAGISYTTCFSGIIVSASAGWEMQHWCDQIPGLSIFSSNHSLDIQGLTAALKVRF